MVLKVRVARVNGKEDQVTTRRLRKVITLRRQVEESSIRARHIITKRLAMMFRVVRTKVGQLTSTHVKTRCRSLAVRLRERSINVLVISLANVRQVRRAIFLARAVALGGPASVKDVRYKASVFFGATELSENIGLRKDLEVRILRVNVHSKAVLHRNVIKFGAPRGHHRFFLLDALPMALHVLGRIPRVEDTRAVKVYVTGACSLRIKVAVLKDYDRQLLCGERFLDRVAASVAIGGRNGVDVIVSCVHAMSYAFAPRSHKEVGAVVNRCLRSPLARDAIFNRSVRVVFAPFPIDMYLVLIRRRDSNGSGANLGSVPVIVECSIVLGSVDRLFRNYVMRHSVLKVVLFRMVVGRIVAFYREECGSLVGRFGEDRASRHLLVAIVRVA